MPMDTLNRVNVDRYTDGPDALPIGKPRTQLPSTKVEMGLDRDRELYRMRTQPHLYDEWMLDLVHNARVAVVNAINMYDWDCDACKSAVLTYRLSDPCPLCGTR